MYTKTFKVALSENKVMVPRKILFYQNDAYSSVIEFKLMSEGKSFRIDDDMRFRLFLQDPAQTPPSRDIAYLVQDDESTVEVDADKQGIVRIALNEELVANHGKNLEAFLECYSFKNPENSCRFQSFTIDILPKDRSRF